MFVGFGFFLFFPLFFKILFPYFFVFGEKMQQVLKPLLLLWGLLSCFCYCLPAIALFLLLIQQGPVLC